MADTAEAAEAPGLLFAPEVDAPIMAWTAGLSLAAGMIALVADSLNPNSNWTQGSSAPLHQSGTPDSLPISRGHADAGTKIAFLTYSHVSTDLRPDQGAITTISVTNGMRITTNTTWGTATRTRTNTYSNGTNTNFTWYDRIIVGTDVSSEPVVNPYRPGWSINPNSPGPGTVNAPSRASSTTADACGLGGTIASCQTPSTGPLACAGINATSMLCRPAEPGPGRPDGVQVNTPLGHNNADASQASSITSVSTPGYSSALGGGGFAPPGIRLGTAGDECSAGGGTGVSEQVSQPGLRNGSLAGSSHPVSGVPFNSSGFPDFSQWRHPDVSDVRIEPSGRRSTDIQRANEAAGLDCTPAGYTWHHNEERGLMQLIESVAHQQTGHTGGFSLWH